MTIAEQAGRQVYRMDEIIVGFAVGEAVARFGLSDRSGFQTDFIEVQVWDRSSLPTYSALRASTGSTAATPRAGK
jgi:hypothetical protein